MNLYHLILHYRHLHNHFTTLNLIHNPILFKINSYIQTRIISNKKTYDCKLLWLSTQVPCTKESHSTESRYNQISSQAWWSTRSLSRSHSILCLSKCSQAWYLCAQYFACDTPKSFLPLSKILAWTLSSKVVRSLEIALMSPFFYSRSAGSGIWARISHRAVSLFLGNLPIDTGLIFLSWDYQS